MANEGGNEGDPQPLDDELLARVRAGDREAYGVLYRRHLGTARRLARGWLLNRRDTDDVVADVFAAILGALEAGRGPDGTFVGYLAASLRHACWRANRRAAAERIRAATASPAEADEGSVFADVEDASVVRAAFDSLAPQFRDVLWRTAVDHRTPTDLAAEYAASPHAVAVLAARARRALGTAYLSRHVDEPAAPEHPDACRQARPFLAALVRGAVGSRRRRRVEEHLAACSECRRARDTLAAINRHLRAPVLASGAAHAWLTGMTTTIRAQLGSLVAGSTTSLAASSLAVVTVLAPIDAEGPVRARREAAPAVAPDSGHGAEDGPLGTAPTPVTVHAPAPDATGARAAARAPLAPAGTSAGATATGPTDATGAVAMEPAPPTIEVSTPAEATAAERDAPPAPDIPPRAAAPPAAQRVPTATTSPPPAAGPLSAPETAPGPPSGPSPGPEANPGRSDAPPPGVAQAAAGRGLPGGSPPGLAGAAQPPGPAGPPAPPATPRPNPPASSPGRSPAAGAGGGTGAGATPGSGAAQGQQPSHAHSRGQSQSPNQGHGQGGQSQSDGPGQQPGPSQGQGRGPGG